MTQQAIYSPDKVEIKTKEKTLQGLLMPGTNNSVVILKLSSGYNIGIERKKILEIKTLQLGGKKSKQTATEKPQKEIYAQDNLPTISLLHTGGTISSKINYETGGVSAKFTPEDIIAMFPALEDIANIRSRLISNMFSEDMRFQHYNLIAKEIQQEIAAGVHGIIITHGTDTLAYTAAALRFIFEKLPIPVLLVGSQRSSDRGSTDAALNLMCAAHVIAKSDFADIGICMHTSSSDETCDILPATKTRKMHTSRRDTFKAINSSPYARVDKQGTITYLNKTYHTKGTHTKIMPKLFNEHLKIGMLKIHPHMYAQEYEPYINFDGLIVEGTGLGHAPINVIDDATKEHKKMLDMIKKLAAKMPVVMAPQPLYGRINMNVYSTGRTLKELGVLGDYSDLLPETAFIKLAWLLSNYPKEEAKKLIGENLRGEITKRSLQHDFIG